MTIILDGTTGITSPDLEVSSGGSAAAPTITTTGDTNTGIFFPAADTIAFAEGGEEAMRINSSGNVGIGTSSPSAKLDVRHTSFTPTSTIGSILVEESTTWSQGIQFYLNNAGANFSSRPSGALGAANSGALWLTSGSILTDNPSASNAFTATTTNASIYRPESGAHIWYGNTGLTAGNTFTPTERARITSGGGFQTPSTATDPHNFGVNRQDGVTFDIVNANATSPYGANIRFTGASPDNNTNYFLLCSDSTANRTIIYSDGDVWTSDAGTLSSDEKLKNTITDASPKLDDVMRLRVRNYYWNEDYHPEKTDKKLIGFIAQEFEEVFPGLVTEGVIRGGNPIYEDQAVVDEDGNPVLDEEGNAKTEQVQVGETEKEYAKGIKEGKLIPILVKALQEAVERIETLEAKVAALEAK